MHYNAHHPPLCALIALAACAAGAPVDVGILSVERTPDEFPSPGLIGWTGGESRREGGPVWRAGDAALFGLRLDTPGGSKDWLVRFAVERTPSQTGSVRQMLGRVNDTKVNFRLRDVEVRVAVFDGSGRLQSETTSTVGDAYLETGLYEGCVLARELGFEEGMPPVQLSTGDAESLAKSLISLVALFEVLQDSESLQPILMEVVQKPSLLSIIGSLGVEVSVRPEVHAAEPVDVEILDAGPLLAVPVELHANGELALICRFLVARPLPPFQLSAGVVGIDAVHPTDPRRRFSMRLLSARSVDDR